MKNPEILPETDRKADSRGEQAGRPGGGELKMPSEIKLIAGLGNPGAEYEATRHNVGFMVVDRLLDRWGRGRFSCESGCESRIFSGNFRGGRMMLQQPQTFMNLSGNAVGKLARKNGLTPGMILVIYDDLDLPLGTMRIRQGGSSGGHNGIKSVIEALGSESFPRLRIGIGRPELESADYVLSCFDESEKELAAKVFDRACDAVDCLLRCGPARAMNLYNGKIEEQKIIQ